MIKTETVRLWSDEELHAAAVLQVTRRLAKGNNQEYGKQGATREFARKVDDAFRGLKLEMLVCYMCGIPFVPKNYQWETQEPDIGNDGEIRNLKRGGKVVPIRPSDRAMVRLKRKLILGYAETETVYGWLPFEEALNIADNNKNFYLSNPLNGGAPYWEIPFSYFINALRPLDILPYYKRKEN